MIITNLGLRAPGAYLVYSGASLSFRLLDIIHGIVLVGHWKPFDCAALAVFVICLQRCIVSAGIP